VQTDVSLLFKDTQAIKPGDNKQPFLSLPSPSALDTLEHFVAQRFKYYPPLTTPTDPTTHQTVTCLTHLLHWRSRLLPSNHAPESPLPLNHPPSRLILPTRRTFPSTWSSAPIPGTATTVSLLKRLVPLMFYLSHDEYRLTSPVPCTRPVHPSTHSTYHGTAHSFVNNLSLSYRIIPVLLATLLMLLSLSDFFYLYQLCPSVGFDSVFNPS
ncbi:unnamed protein product, partial [Mycena citricolor]